MRANEQVIGIAVLMRAMSGLFAGATFVAALGVWLVPAMAFVATAFTAKMTISVLLMCVAFMLARVAARGTRVRIQVDTAVGELREVVDGSFGAGGVLAQYGLDAVEAVEIISSQVNRSFGQIQIRIKGIGPVPAGDGALSALTPLRNRIAQDCGLEESGPVRAAVWSGPLAA